MLTLLSLFLFGGDVDSLGSREWREREAAQTRLAAAGWWAGCAELRGLASDCPERSERCARLLDGLPRLDDGLARMLVSGDAGVADEQLVRLREAVGRIADGVLPITVVGKNPEQRAVLAVGTDVALWMSRPMFYGGTEAGEVRVVLAAIRRKMVCGE